MGRQIILALSTAALLFGSCARQKMHFATAGPLAGFEKEQNAACIQVSFFPLESVRLTESAFKRAQEMDRCYLMSLDPDRLLAPYLKEAGLEPKAENPLFNWPQAVVLHMPVLIGDEATLLGHISKAEDEQLTFRLEIGE